MSSLLRSGGYALSNVYETIPSNFFFEEVLQTYIDAINKEQEEIGNKYDIGFT